MYRGEIPRHDEQYSERDSDQEEGSEHEANREEQDAEGQEPIVAARLETHRRDRVQMQFLHGIPPYQQDATVREIGPELSC